MGVGPAHQPQSPLALLSGRWATFPTCGTVPHMEGVGSLGKIPKKILKKNLIIVDFGK